jgi:hypothetical protein
VEGKKTVMNRRSCPQSFIIGEESDMDTAKREAAWAQLQTRRKLIRLELASVEHKLARARGQILSLQERIATLSPSHRRAA